MQLRRRVLHCCAPRPRVAAGMGYRSQVAFCNAKELNTWLARATASKIEASAGARVHVERVWLQALEDDEAFGSLSYLTGYVTGRRAGRGPRHTLCSRSSEAQVSGGWWLSSRTRNKRARAMNGNTAQVAQKRGTFPNVRSSCWLAATLQALFASNKLQQAVASHRDCSSKMCLMCLLRATEAESRRLAAFLERSSRWQFFMEQSARSGPGATLSSLFWHAPVHCTAKMGRVFGVCDCANPRTAFCDSAASPGPPHTCAAPKFQADSSARTRCARLG